MITKSFRLEDLEKVKICIGYVGENKHTQVRIDCSSAFAEYPGATPVLAVQPPRGGVYPAVIEQDGNVVVWDVTNSDLLFRGEGAFQFSFTLGDVVKKTVPGKFIVQKSIITTANVPAPVAEWLIRAEKALEGVEAAEINQPMIGLDGYWYKWDQENGEYVKTDTKAQGEDGDPGQPGQDATPDLITVPYEDLTFPVAVGTQCYHGGKLYEANQAIQTSEQWTAAHWTETTVEEQLTRQKSALQVLEPSASAADIGKALIVKTVENGKPTSYEYGKATVDPEDIATAADAWLDENITNPSNPPLDRSLTLSNAAAPADLLGDLNSKETYTTEPVVEYTAITATDTVSSARTTINGNGVAFISTPTVTSIKIYPVTNGKTYKVKGYCKNATDRPMFVVADSKVTSGVIAQSGSFEYEKGTGNDLAVEEKEYTAVRTGYLYLNYYDSTCGLWEKTVITPAQKKYYMDDVRSDIAGLKTDMPFVQTSIDNLNKVIYRQKTDSRSLLVKVVPKNAENVAKVTSIADSVTLVRSILGRNWANKNTVGDVAIDESGTTTQKGIKTVRLPAGRYLIDMTGMSVYICFKRIMNGVYSTTYYQSQTPMKLTIDDPYGGYFIVYASSEENLGDLTNLFIGKLGDGETTIAFEAYSEKTYTAETLSENNNIEVHQNGLVAFENSANADVASTIEYTVSGRDDYTTTSKNFVVSPNGNKFLPMVKNDGSAVYSRIVPKKALFIGNSLTSGWQTFGEAATESDNDFIALFGDVVSNIDESYTYSRVWATGFETQTSLANAQSWTTTNIDPSLSNDLDLIVVQLSDNVTENLANAVETFPLSSLWLMQHIRESCPKARVIWMSIWFNRGWTTTLVNNAKATGCEYVDILPLFTPENVSSIGTVYKMDADFTKSYDVDSFVVSNGTIELTFTVDGTQYTSTIPSYTSYTSSGDTQISVTGIYHVINTYYASIHPSDEGFRKIANKLLFDLGISDSEETIPAST